MKLKSLFSKPIIISIWIAFILCGSTSYSEDNNVIKPYPINPPESDNKLSNDPNFKNIIDALGKSTPHLKGQCNAGRDEILNKLAKIRQEHPEWFVNIDYGPVEKEGSAFGHVGVVFYYKSKEPNPDYSVEGYLRMLEKSGVVVDYTNYWSDYTGNYRVRSWNWWRWFDFFGKGTISTEPRKFTDFYWNPNGPIYPGEGMEPEKENLQHTTNPQFKITFPIRVIVPEDPNEKVGAKGIGPDPRYLSGEEPLRYTIFFENLRKATGPALVVAITDQLDENLDLKTFTLGPISFGDKTLYPSGNPKEFSIDYDLRPQKNAILRIQAKLDGNVVTWEFKTLDPYTKEINLDPWAGFLPPNINPPEGEGSVTFTVMAKAGLPTGTSIRNRATIKFDLNDPMDTNEWENIIDKTLPSSRVLPLAPTQSSPTFLVSWVGEDTGSGIHAYNIYVSENGAPYKIWLRDTQETSASFTGQLGHRYSFYSVARDNAGNMESHPKSPEATTSILALGMKTICSYLGNDPKPSILDQDIFKFQASEGEEITITLEANPPEAAMGKRATLLLVDNIMGIFLFRVDRSSLPNQIQTTIPKSGQYLITVSEQIDWPRGTKYKGPYCLTLKAKTETSQTLTPFKWVE